MQNFAYLPLLCICTDWGVWPQLSVNIDRANKEHLTGQQEFTSRPPRLLHCKRTLDTTRNSR